MPDAPITMGPPWLRIAEVVQAGAVTVVAIKLALPKYARKGCGRNCSHMVRRGLLAEVDGVFSLTPSGLAGIEAAKLNDPPNHP